MIAAVDLAAVLLLLSLAAWSIFAPDPFASIAGFVALGFFLVVAWLRLAAPDVALTEGAVGSGLAGLLLFSAHGALRGKPAVDVAPPHRRLHGIAVALLCAGVATGLAVTVMLLPEPAPSQATRAMAQLPDLGVKNPVVGVLMGFRALDTLMEVVALFLALAGVWSLADTAAWGGVPRVPTEPRCDALIFLARVLPPFGLILGVYIVWNGSDAAGGEFPGSAVLASMWLLLMIAGLVRLPAVSQTSLRLWIVAGPLVFFGIGIAGFALAGAFLGYPPHLAKTLIVAIEFPLTVSLAIMLALLIAGPPALLRTPQPPDPTGP